MSVTQIRCERELSLVGQVQQQAVIFVLDKSGSMSGERWSSLVRGVGHVVTQLSQKDALCAVTFDSKTAVVQEFCNAGAGAQRALVERLSREQPGGQTALYDALSEALVRALLLDAHTKQRWHFHVVVMTDGEDNKSEAGAAEQAVKLFQALGEATQGRFHIDFVGLGLSTRTRASVEALLAKAGGNAKYHASESAACLEGIFEHIALSLQVTTRVQQQTVDLARALEAGDEQLEPVRQSACCALQ